MYCECDGLIGLNDRCIDCGRKVAPVPMVRISDPVESLEAASKVNVAQDRQLILRVFVSYGGPLTYREAALRAVDGESSLARIESLRRRGSDLKKRGWITQIGRESGQARFVVTSIGENVLS